MRCDWIYWSNSTTYQFCHGQSSGPWFTYALEDPNGRKAEAAIFVASAVMFVLGLILLGLSILQGRLSGRAALNPTVRVFLYASFALFLPLMSYMFSQAKDEAKQQQATKGLPIRAHVILIWMLLVELLRKKVDAILAAMGSSPPRAAHQQQTLWDAVDQIVSIAWTGYLVYSYVHGVRKPGLVILWALALAKAAQRVAAVEVAKRSFAVGKNAHVVAGYTAQMLELELELELEADGRRRVDEQGSGAALLCKCWYAVMGEDRLKREAGPDGYRVELPADESEEKKDLVTVGDIWELAGGGGGGDDKPVGQLLTDHPRLKDVCLAFALFKLLKARFENLKVHEGVVVKNRGLIFRGLGGGDGRDGGAGREVDSSSDHRDTSAEKVFDVIELELNLVMDYYHSVVPVAMCSPWLLVGNHVLAFLVVLNQAVMVLFMAGNGRLLPAIGCLARDAVARSQRAMDLLRCLGHKLLKTVAVMLSSLNFLVCLMLVLTFVLLEASELVVYLLSDWFLVSMVCEYARRPRWRSSRCVRRAFASLLWVKRVGRRPRAGMRISQVCVLDLRRRHKPWLAVSKYLRHHRVLGMPSVPVPREVKRAVFEALAAKATGGEPLSNGAAVLRRGGHRDLLWACESRSVTRVILVWHIATSLFETKNAAESTGRSAEETVAATLSRYCAYLVACAPELLPENQEGSKRVYETAKRDLRRALGGKRRGGDQSESESRLDRMMRIEKGGPDDSDVSAASMGAELGKQLLEGCGFDDDDGGGVARWWALLAELWTELVVYIAPSKEMEGHAKALARGGEFITLLWALATHVGITR